MPGCCVHVKTSTIINNFAGQELQTSSKYGDLMYIGCFNCYIEVQMLVATLVNLYIFYIHLYNYLNYYLL